jgi:hypothetical protein
MGAVYMPFGTIRHKPLTGYRLFHVYQAILKFVPGSPIAPPVYFICSVK